MFAVEGGTPDQRKIFYTGVYHSFLSPNIFSDEDGQYIGFDGKVHSLSGTKQKAQYANFSDWDIYRNTVQLQALFEPRARERHDAVAGERCGAERMVSALACGERRDLCDGRRFAGMRCCHRRMHLARGVSIWRQALKFMVKGGTQPGNGSAR